MKRRALLKLVLTERDRHCANRCVYCGAPCYGRACGSHRPLIQIDPIYGGVQ